MAAAGLGRHLDDVAANASRRRDQVLCRHCSYQRLNPRMPGDVCKLIIRSARESCLQIARPIMYNAVFKVATMQTAKIRVLLLIGFSVILIAGTLAYVGWQVSESLREHGVVVLAVWVPGMVFLGTVAAFAGTWGWRTARREQRLLKESGPDKGSAVIEIQRQHSKLGRVYVGGAVLIPPLGIVGFVLVSAPIWMYPVLAISCAAMLYAGILYRRLPPP